MPDTETDPSTPGRGVAARSTTSPCGSAASPRSTRSNFDIKEGEILGLIGPNGAGKTTCFNVMTGVYQADQRRDPLRRQVRWRGMKRYQITKLGIARTFQNIRLFNVDDRPGERHGRRRRQQHRSGLLNALFRTPLHRPDGAPRRATQADRAARVRRHRGPGRRARREPLLRRPAPPRDRPGDGHRAEAALLDEPAAGFNPAEKQRLMELIRKVRDQGYTVLLIEHDMRPGHGRHRPDRRCSSSGARSPRARPPRSATTPR